MGEAERKVKNGIGVMVVSEKSLDCGEKNWWEVVDCGKKSVKNGEKSGFWRKGVFGGVGSDVR